MQHSHLETKALSVEIHYDFMEIFANIWKQQDLDLMLTKDP